MDNKKLLITGVLVGLIIFLYFGNSGSSITGNVVGSGSSGEISNLHEANLEIEGMYCESCAYGIEAQMREVEGVISANVDYKNAKGVVRYDADVVDLEKITAASTVYPAIVASDKKLK